jgi:hypothetical protein
LTNSIRADTVGHPLVGDERRFLDMLFYFIYNKNNFCSKK